MPIFDIFEGISFEIRIREQNHPVPHVHAYYGEQQVSIALDGTVFAGGFKNRKKQRMAIDYVKSHCAELMEEWRKYHV